MKVFIILAVVAFAAGGAWAIIQKDIREIEDELNSCTKEIGVSFEEVDNIQQGNFVNINLKVMCFTNCLLEKEKIIKDGVLQELAIYEQASKDGENKDDVKKFLDACRDKKGANKCETAYKIYKCSAELNNA